MASQREAIAQAVVDALNAATVPAQLNQSITAVLRYVPAISLTDLADLSDPNQNPGNSGVVVTVVPIGPEKRTSYDRHSVRKDLQIHVAIQKKVTTLTSLDDGSTNPASIVTNAEVSGLMELTEQIAAVLEPGGAGPTLGNKLATWMGSETPVLYDLDHLLTDHVFTSLLLVTYMYL